MKKVIIPGGSGFLGRYLAAYLIEKGYTVIILSRKKGGTKDNITYLQWDGKTLGDWAKAFEGAEAVVNLAGRTVDCRYTEKNKQEILNSRIDATKVVGQAIFKCKQPPKVWLNASTATIYKGSYDIDRIEDGGEIGNDFSMNVAKTWEKTFYEAPAADIRKVAMRISIVLGKGGGAMMPLVNLTKLGLGGKQGSGQQYVSWLHIEDFARAVVWLIEQETISGSINIVSPKPIRNKEFMRTLQRVIGIPFGLPATKWMLEIGTFFLQTEAELVLKSRKVVPKRLLEAGFKHQFTDLEMAMRSILS